MEDKNLTRNGEKTETTENVKNNVTGGNNKKIIIVLVCIIAILVVIIGTILNKDKIFKSNSKENSATSAPTVNNEQISDSNNSSNSSETSKNILVNKDEVSFEIPKSMDTEAYMYKTTYSDVEKMGISSDKNAIYYKIQIKNDGKLSSTKDSVIDAFTIMITSDDTYLNSSWRPIGDYNGRLKTINERQKR